MGVGILSLPYALRLSGWAGIGLLLLLAVITSYTAMLLGKMLNYMPGMTSYPDVGQVSTHSGNAISFDCSQRRWPLSTADYDRQFATATPKGCLQVAFGTYGRYFICAIVYLELLTACIMFASSSLPERCRRR
jgi:hypothetical protein